MDLYQQTQQLLDELTWQLQQHQLWSDTAPAASALQSQAPFCVDTMPFASWLQFVFLPRMQALVATKQPLPTRMQITPMAEVVYEGQEVKGLIQVLHALDSLLSKSQQGPTHA